MLPFVLYISLISPSFSWAGGGGSEKKIKDDNSVAYRSRHYVIHLNGFKAKAQKKLTTIILMMEHSFTFIKPYIIISY